MMTIPRIFHKLEELKKANIKYILSIGKRQPMHIGHKKSLEKLLSIDGITLIYVIGSVNLGGDPLFDPFTNPLNLEQQIEQFKITFPGKQVIFLPIPDVADMSKWGPSIVEALEHLHITPESCAIHFIGKPEDRLVEPSSFFLASGEEVTLEKGQWLIEAIGYYDIAIWFDNELPVDLSLSARNLRELDLEHLSLDQRNMLAAPDYLLSIAKAARDKESTGPVTMRDLSKQRIKLEKN